MKINHYGVILNNGPPASWDAGATGFCNAFIDTDGPKKIYLYYSGACDIAWSHSAIGLATSENGFNFKKENSNPVLDGDTNSFCSKQALTPAVTKIGCLYYMIFAGCSSHSPRQLGIAYADDPKGPWKIIDEILKPVKPWEGRGIDLGPSIVKIKDDTILVFYSNISINYKELLSRYLRNPTLQNKDLLQYVKRRIGIAKIRISGKSKNDIKVQSFYGNPLTNLNGLYGQWNESLFCPGYMQVGNVHFLFPAASTYSVGFPYKQYIGMIKSTSPYFVQEKVEENRILINGPKEKNSILPNVKSELALDTPSPFRKNGGQDIYLCYAVMDRDDGIWKTALSSFSLKEDLAKSNKLL